MAKSVLFDRLTTREQAEGVARSLRQRFSGCTTIVRKRKGDVAVYVNASCRVFDNMGRRPEAHARLVAARGSGIRGVRKRRRKR